MINKMQFFRQGKSLVNRIIQARKYAIKFGGTHLPKEWAEQEMRNIVAAMEAISTYDRFARYITRKKTDIRLLIPTNKKAMLDEYDALVEVAETIVERELTYK